MRRSHATHATGMGPGMLWGRISARLLSVHVSTVILWRFEMCSLAARFADAPSLVRAAAIFTIVLDTFHAFTIAELIVPSETGATTSTSSGTFVMPG